MRTDADRALCRAAWLCGLCLLLGGCSKRASNPDKDSLKSPASVSSPERDGSKTPVTVSNKLLEHVWQVEQPASGFASTIYIFVPDGTLLETSCKETYRIAKWSADPKLPGVIQVVEDGQPAFTGTIADAGPSSLHLQRRLRHGEADEMKLTAVAGEFVCPDLR